MQVLGVSFFLSVFGQSAASHPRIPSPTLPSTSFWKKSTVVMASQVVVVSNNLNDLNTF